MHQDPYRLANIHREGDLPPHPRPRQYRELLFAMAEFLEERHVEAAVSGSMVRSL